MPNDKPKPKISDIIDKTEKVGDAVKEFTPDKIDTLIDTGTQTARLFDSFKGIFGGLFKKKTKVQ